MNSDRLFSAKAYLSSDGAGEAPHGLIGGVVLATAPHLKGKGHSVSFNLQQDAEGTLGCGVTCVVVVLVRPGFTLTRSLGHPVPRTLRLPYPRVFPPYSVTFRLLVLGPA